MSVVGRRMRKVMGIKMLREFVTFFFGTSPITISKVNTNMSPRTFVIQVMLGKPGNPQIESWLEFWLRKVQG